MRVSAVAARYANALADVVTGKTSTVKPADALAELKSFESLLSSSAELHNALVTPAVAAGRKKAVVGRLGLEMQLSQVTRNFLFVLVDHRRIAELRNIVESLEVVLDERLGYLRAEVVSARELNQQQREALDRELERVSGKRIRAQYAVDPSLIGGAVARIGSTVYDGSVRGQLESLGRRLGAAT
jgi:F-type H+-transporting ATPase subunit delta